MGTARPLGTQRGSRLSSSFSAGAAPWEAGCSRSRVPLLRSAGGFVGNLSPLAAAGRFCFTVGLESGRGSCRCAGWEPPALSRPGPLPLDSRAGGGKHPPSFLCCLGEARGRWGPGQHSQGGAATCSLMLLHFRPANPGWE